MSLKDTTVYDKLEPDNWEEWEQNTLNLLDTKHLRDYTEIDYGPAIERAQEYRRLRQQEVLLFAATPLTSPSRFSSKTTASGEKAIASLKKVSSKLASLELTVAILRTSKDGGAAAQLESLELEIDRAKQKVLRLKGTKPNDADNTKKINDRVYPGKTDNEIKSHLESVRELEIGAAHTHALLSASVSKGLRSYVQAVTKGKPNPYVLWHALKDRFHNKSLNLQANLQRFGQARKEGDEQMMDFIARLQQLRLLASTDSSPIGDDNFVARLRAGLPGEYNSTQSTIASYLKSRDVIDVEAVDHICAILLDHEVVLENLASSSDSSALWTGNAASTKNRPTTSKTNDRSNSRRGGHSGNGQRSSGPTVSRPGPTDANAGQSFPPARNMSQYCTYHEAPGHTLADCNAAKSARGNGSRGTGKRNHKRDNRHKATTDAHLVSAASPATSAIADTAHTVHSPATTAVPSPAAQADAQWPVDDYDSDDCLLSSAPTVISALSGPSASSRAPYPPPIVDSGCTSHLTGHAELLHRYVRHPPRTVTVANNTTVTSCGVGVIRGHILIDGRLEPVQIKNVQHVPDIPHTLISPLQLEDNGLTLQWRRGYGVEFYQGSRLRLFTIRRGRHIILPLHLDLARENPPDPVLSSSSALAIDLDLVHRRLGHACEALCRSHVEQSDYTDAEKARLRAGKLTLPCRVCTLGKQVAKGHQKQPIPPSVQTEHPGEILSADLLTAEVTSTGGAQYILAVTNVRTRYHWTVPIKLKSDASDKLRHIILGIPSD
jgi:hypothetical protein